MNPIHRFIPGIIVAFVLVQGMQTSLVAQDFNKQINHIEHIVYLNPIGEKITWYTASEQWFDKTGNLVEEKHYGKDVGAVTWEKHDWADGLKMSTNYYDSLGHLTGSSFYSYDSHRRLNAVQRRLVTGVMVYTVSYLYDEEGRISEYIRHNADSSTFAHATYTYDKKGRLSNSRWFDSQGNLRTSIEYASRSEVPEALIDTMTGSSTYTKYVVRKKKVRVMRRNNAGKMYLADLILLGNGTFSGSDGNGEGDPDLIKQEIRSAEGSLLERNYFDGERLVRVDKFIHTYYSE